jgi:hypothetical protein
MAVVAGGVGEALDHLSSLWATMVAGGEGELHVVPFLVALFFCCSSWSAVVAWGKRVALTWSWKVVRARELFFGGLSVACSRHPTGPKGYRAAAPLCFASVGRCGRRRKKMRDLIVFR